MAYICPILDNVPCVLEKNVYSAVVWYNYYGCLVGCRIIQVFYLLISCLVVLSIIEIGELKSLTINVELSVSPLNSINFSLFILGMYMFISVICF